MLVHCDHEELGVVHTVEVLWRDSIKADLYVRCLCFILASIVFNLLTTSFAGRTVTPFSSRSHEFMNESRLACEFGMLLFPSKKKFSLRRTLVPVDTFRTYIFYDG